MLWALGKRFVVTAVAAGCSIHITTTYIGNLTVSKGPSMMPTINPSGDILLTETITPRMGKLQRGDVIVAKSVTNPKSLVCKRIIAMEGERVCVNPTGFPKRFRTVPRGRVWLQGDNLSNSTDSRTYGFVPLALVTSRVVARVWPPQQFKFIERELPQFLPSPSSSSSSSSSSSPSQHCEESMTAAIKKSSSKEKEQGQAACTRPGEHTSVQEEGSGDATSPAVGDSTTQPGLRRHGPKSNATTSGQHRAVVAQITADNKQEGDDRPPLEPQRQQGRGLGGGGDSDSCGADGVVVVVGATEEEGEVNKGGQVPQQADGATRVAEGERIEVCSGGDYDGHNRGHGIDGGNSTTPAVR
ncbi:inner membrane protease subunit [Salpingoeca rosetta]|uniref:Inner membrane protease subunit n=1 Tax=Salpingoeca rosetta (strain ATCC 50818 / BSB-021) TaxID=946362 RepID=F2U1G3_SALR5|nr:inner membrane protease subunit [Salpingoeca rosetta]EGD81465.1 inner membrane protease subunit [Salpingoeca rosetta]|eukprot:XP_004996669.1 inner membrane protease subunit [Salpingoeca rosetta]